MRQTNKDKKVILSIDNLKKYFINNGIINKAVDGVSFDVHEGEIVGLIGESGSGKTTVGRTLLRLYDEYNGFVILDDKIISGKSISYTLKKYLRKNVQMIFQDPHASLNSQQNVYNILKEPLLVNGIMKNKIKDIFCDWLEVKKTFKYTFQIQAMKLELENLKEINNLARPFFSFWVKKFENFKFDKELSIEDNFSSFYAYLEEKQKMESLIINNMYSNASTLINYYYEMQSKYRNQELTVEETNFNKAIRRFEEVKILSKISKNQFKLKKELAKLQTKRKALIANYHSQIKESQNVFSNYCIENKNEKSLTNITKLMSTNLEFYSYNLKNEYLFQKRVAVLKSLKSTLKHLEFEDIKDLVKKLEAYVKNFYEKELSAIQFSKTIKQEIKDTINTKFNFDFSKYQTISLKNAKQFEDKLKKLDEEISNLKNELQIKEAPEVSFDELQKAKEDLNKSKEKYLLGRANFLVDYKQKINDLYEQIKKEKDEYLFLVSSQTMCDEAYKKFKNEFFLHLRNSFDEKITALQKTKEDLLAKLMDESADKEKLKKGIKQITLKTKQLEKDHDVAFKMYNSDITLKEDTLKSFKIERDYLNKDIKNIYVLLGIDYKWVELNIRNNILNENQTKDGKQFHTKWTKRFNFFDYKISLPIAKYLISELLYKMTIYRSLEDVGLLKQFAYRYPHEFSGGQLQRIVIARALITEPKVIVADEPIASLDISIQAQVVNLLKDLCIQKNIGLIFIAHDLSMIEYVADNVQIMHLGKIVESGQTEAIYNNPLHPYTISLFKAIPKISNANEKFHKVSFELDYIQEQQFPNIPEVYKAEDNHYIYGTKDQIKKWTSVLSNKKED
ncbi:Oligopeptide ABC transporter, ATP-binding protein [Metamycoplasma auris 15026]|uniref:Oligopeptide ABC transporter, ATP-binding protein n=1 Tax=Metamycoplasma auris 15026 TaxID=1188233 RepID=N9UZ73_9BACT|nr:ATP-binding cassette domain-containing protein [Metamycoplasma auris]ENY68492.1 Oligopeptide ABC transporter, ATP-binding protein [Metamycoplasma auris 15026]